MYKKLFLSMAVCASLAACSSNDEPAANDSFSGDKAYVAIRLVNSNAGSRGSDGSFENGTGNESDVKTADFIFYNADGSYYNKATANNLSWTNNTDGSNVEKYCQAVTVLNKLADKSTPAYVVAVINAPQGAIGTLENKTIAEAKAITSSWGTNTEGGFVMTNSTYDNGDANSQYFATPVSAANFLTEAPNEQTLTQDNAVTIYIERLAAKTTLNWDLQNGQTQENNKTQIGTLSYNGVQTPIYATITGWALTNTNPTSYLFKNVPAWNTGLGFTWSVPSLFRCYWATSVPFGPTNVKGLVNRTQLTNALGTAAYCNENTCVIENDPNFRNNATSILVGATVTVGDNAAATIYRFGAGLFDEDNFKAQAASAVYTSFYTRTGDDQTGYTYTSITPALLEVTATTDPTAQAGAGHEQGRVTVQLVSGNTTPLYHMVNGIWTAWDRQAANIFLAQTIKADQYQNGQMYYDIPIEHLRGGQFTYNTTDGTYTVKVADYGVVRNHVYKVAINSITNLGAPLNNDEQIVPGDKKNETYYIGATINILAWHIVNQGVDL